MTPIGSMPESSAMDTAATFQIEAAGRKGLPRLLIAARTFGAPGRPWMWRQVVGMNAFRRELVCWERVNRQTQPTEGLDEHIIRGNPAPYDGPARWLHRARTAFSGNFYAAAGAERVRLQRLLAERSPDVILCHFGDMGMRLQPVARKAGIPLLVYFHGDFPFLRNRWYRWSLVRCIPHFAGVVVVTQAERRWFEDHGMDPAKIHYIPCGAPTDVFRPRERRPDGQVRFVMVSRLQPDKGCDVSIAAFARVARTCANAWLDIFGEGEERANLEGMVNRLGIREKVHFRGHVTEPDLARELPDFDVFIQHSRVREGSPVSLAEAMACGLPVVATPVGGIPDQIVPGQTGYLVPEEDCEAMAQSMEMLAKDPILRRRLGGAARAYCLARHDAARQTRKLEAVLLSAAMR